MNQTWAVACHMIAEGLRMKIALVFLVLLGMIVVSLPFSISGDSSLTGAVQSFISYGLTATGFLLGVLTIFMSRSLSDELVHRQAFLVLTKPIPRWQFVLGKWLGITILDAAFLAFSGLTIYGMVHYIIHTHPPIDQRLDEKELKGEVLVARHAIKAKLPDFTRAAEAEYERNLEEGIYANTSDLDPQKEKARLVKKYEARWGVVGPLEDRVFQFENVLCDRTLENTIQLRYKTEVSRYPPDEIFRAWWRFGDPSKGTPTYTAPTRHVVGRFHTIRIPADAVAEDHTLTARFHNENPFEGEPQWGNVIEFLPSTGVEILFMVGTFEWNLVRLLILVMCKLMFLAAVAVLMTTVFSFPVACLAAFTIYVLAAARSFLGEAFDWTATSNAMTTSPVKDFLVEAVAFVLLTIYSVLPDFSRFDALETFVNGRNVSLVWVLQGISEVALLKTMIVLGLAMLVFHRREIAEASV